MVFNLYVPDWSLLSISGTIFGLALGLMAIATESSNPTPYSKFGGKGSLPSKLAMFFIYSPSALIALLYLNAVTTQRFYVLDIVTLLHFVKRLLEVAFVHIYTSKTDAGTTIAISSTYALTSALNLAIVRRIPEDAFSNDWLTIGLLCAISGELINGYHHILLRRLRTERKKNDSKGSYVLPRGGLFDYSVAPHYAAEQLTFIGIILLSQNVVSVAINFFPMIYLTLRAARTHEWYAAHLPEHEKVGLHRRARLIPGVW